MTWSRIEFSHRIVLTGTMRKISAQITCLFSIAQVIIARHYERAGLPLVEHYSQPGEGLNPSNKFMVLFMVFVPGVPQIKQLHEILCSILDMGWTWGLILLELHGQRSKKGECICLC